MNSVRPPSSANLAMEPAADEAEWFPTAHPAKANLYAEQAADESLAVKRSAEFQRSPKVAGPAWVLKNRAASELCGNAAR